MRPLLLACIFVWVSTTGSVGQTNLVPNPGFEDFDSCQQIDYYPFSSDGYLPPWYMPTLGTSDYFTGFCGPLLYNGIPFNLAGFQQPHGGIAYSGLLTFESVMDSNINYREYIACPLIAPLQNGKTYDVSFWISPSEITILPVKNNLATNNIGALFTKKYYELFATNTINNIKEVPQFESDSIILDKSKWTKICGRFTADGGEKYIIIGNFRDDEHTKLAQLSYDPSGIEKAYAYIYIDDVSVIETNFGRLLPPDTSICETGFPLTLKAGQPSTNHKWSTGETTPEITINQGGTYFLDAKDGACRLTDTIHVYSKPIPIKEFRDTVVCVSALPYYLKVPANLEKWIWPDGSTIPQYFGANTQGWQVLEGSSACGAFVDSMYLTVDHALDIHLVADSSICQEGIEVPVSIHNSAVLSNYAWSTGETTPTITVSQPGIYFLTSKNQCGADSDSIGMAGCVPRIFIPNVFSPNGDNLNDYFMAFGQNIQFERLLIFDRNGILLFDEQNPKKGWDGQARGKKCQNGVYIYTVSYLTLDGKNQHLESTGTVTLVR